MAGIDSDNNGVRDDVENYIAATYSEPTDSDTRAALMQYAKVLQSTLVDTTTTGRITPAIAGEHLQDVVIAFQCLGAKRPGDFTTVDTKLLDVVLDTVERQQAYLNAAHLAEQSSTPVLFLPPTNWGASCS